MHWIVDTQKIDLLKATLIYFCMEDNKASFVYILWYSEQSTSTRTKYQGSGRILAYAAN